MGKIALQVDLLSVLLPFTSLESLVLQGIIRSLNCTEVHTFLGAFTRVVLLKKLEL